MMHMLQYTENFMGFVDFPADQNYFAISRLQ